MKFKRYTALFILSVIISLVSILTVGGNSTVEIPSNSSTTFVSNTNLEYGIAAHISFYSDVSEEEQTPDNLRVNNYLSFRSGTIVPIAIFTEHVSYTNVNPSSRSPLLKQSSGLAPPIFSRIS